MHAIYIYIYTCIISTFTYILQDCLSAVCQYACLHTI